MAELTTIQDDDTNTCCAPEAQESCCEPSDKAACCGTAAAGGTCGCSAGASAETDVREKVRERYAAAARAVAEAGPSGSDTSCCGSTVGLTDEQGTQVFGDALYDAADTDGAPEAAVGASLGCGVPTAVADLHEGETVLDLGAGAGADVLISAKRVGTTGKAIGLDMTDEMLELARTNASDAGVTNVEFIKGYIEDIPLPAGSVDVVISNCVINLSGDKNKVLAEVARVLRPGGRFAVSDVIADPDMDDATRADMAQWTGCIAGALTREEFETSLATAGLIDVAINETHRVHEHAASAIIRARKPEITA
jgi:arsenite methyltransferase